MVETQASQGVDTTVISRGVVSKAEGAVSEACTSKAFGFSAKFAGVGSCQRR